MSKQTIKKNYCYINDAMGWTDDAYKAEDYRACNSGNKCMTRRCASATVKGLCYRDADGCSNRLYRDLLRIWSKDEILKLYIEDSTKFNLANYNGGRFSCDYIGPSRAWAHYVGIEDREIGEYLLYARTIGGHMIWPVHRIPTINTARAGGGSLFDRIDLTLYEIQGFYLGDVDKSSFSQPLWNVLHNDIEKSFLLSFSNNQYGEAAFKAFIDFWLLQDFVMDAEKEDYRIISLATSEENEKIPISENEAVFPGNISNIWWKDIVFGNISEKNKEILCDAYRKYANNLIKLILRRSEKITHKWEEQYKGANGHE